MENPITKSKLLIIVPVMLAFTMSIKPAFRATMAIINSVALPKTAFNKPPMEGPVTIATSSVAVLNQIARGIMPKADVMKTQREPQCKYSAAMEMGMKINSAMERIFLIDIGTRMVYARVRSSCRGDRPVDFT